MENLIPSPQRKVKKRSSLHNPSASFARLWNHIFLAGVSVPAISFRPKKHFMIKALRYLLPLGLGLAQISPLRPALADSLSLIPAGSVWKFLDNGSDQGTAWTATNFNDGTWSSGPAQLGYGEGDEATVVGYGSDGNNKYTTTYFRRAFVVTNAASMTNLLFRLLRDDGAVVYLNGQELYRHVMPSGTFNYQTFATNTVADADETTFFTNNVTPTALRNGTNVVAVEIHQCNLISSDLSFNLELIGQFTPSGNAPPVAMVTAPADGQFFRASNSIVLAATASDPGGLVALVEFYDGTNRLGLDATSPYSFTWNNALPGAHQVCAVATDNLGARGTSAVVTVNVIANSAPWPVLVSTGSVWKYLDTGVNLSNAWVAPSFDDHAWASGRAELGYGDSSDGRPEATVISYGASDTNKYVTTYFRRTFMATNAAGFTNLYARVLYDDGAVVYLNGIEVSRYNLPSGTITNLTFANSAIGGTDETTFVWSRRLNPALLVEGVNVIAVEVHQSSATSSDLSFDLELLGNVAGPDRTYLLSAGQRGTVRCADALDISYDIYLPPSYTTNGTPLPVLYTFNPNGGGMVGDYQNMAASMQVIVIGVVGSKNGIGYTVYGNELHAVTRDARQRLNLDPTGVYASGFSGGGQVSFEFSRMFGQQLAGVLSLSGWLGKQTNAYTSDDRVRTNLLVARTMGDGDYAGNWFLGPDAVILRSYGAVVRDWMFTGGHEVGPEATRSNALSWLLTQRVTAGPNDRSNAVAQAAVWHARVTAGETVAVLHECMASLLNRPRTWESFYADLLMDELQADSAKFRQLDVSGLAGGDFAQDYFYYRVYLAGVYRDSEIYLSSLKALTGITNSSLDLVRYIPYALTTYGTPAPVVAGVAHTGTGQAEVRYSKDSLGLNYYVERRTNAALGGWTAVTGVETNLGHCFWSTTVPATTTNAAFFRLKASIN